MSFKNGNQYRWVGDVNNPLDRKPIALLGRLGQKEALRNIPGWQNKLRELIDQLINESTPPENM